MQVLPTASCCATDCTQDYTLGRKLGKPGSYGYAQVAVDKQSKVRYAVKVVPKHKFKQPSDVHMFRQEVHLLRELNHPNIVKAHACYENDQEIAIVEDLCAGGELFDRLERKSSVGITHAEHDAADILRQVLQALAYLHAREIAHCDVKPDNILFSSHSSNSHVKLVDFNLARQCSGTACLSGLVGTTYYLAPEVLQSCYSYRADIFSLGVIMFMLLFGFPPFDGQSDEEVMAQIRIGLRAERRPGRGAWFPSDIPASHEALDLLSRMLDSDPATRISASAALHHPWVNGYAPGVPVTPAVLCNLNAFLRAHNFSGMRDVTRNSFSKEDQEALLQLFTQADVDGDGLVTLEQLECVLHLVTPPNSESPGSFSQADSDPLNTYRQISFRDLKMALVHERLLGDEERLRDLFQFLDDDCDGFLGETDIVRALSHYFGQQIDVKRLLSRSSINQVGNVNYDEFLDLFTGSSLPARAAACAASAQHSCHASHTHILDNGNHITHTHDLHAHPHRVVSLKSLKLMHAPDGTHKHPPITSRL